MSTEIGMTEREAKPNAFAKHLSEARALGQAFDEMRATLKLFCHTPETTMQYEQALIRLQEANLWAQSALGAKLGAAAKAELGNAKT